MYGDGLFEIAESVVDHAKRELCAGLRLPVAESVGCGQGPLAGFQRSNMFAGQPKGDGHLAVDETQAAVVAQRSGQRFRIREMPDDMGVITERDQSVDHHEAKIDACFRSCLVLREVGESDQSSLE